MTSRIGKGPWARAFGAALIPDESDPIAVAGRALVDSVTDMRIEPGLITARVGECTVTLSAPTIPPRIWAAMVSYARGRGALEQAVRGEVQSEHLMHLMEQDWDEPLVPPAQVIVRACGCDGSVTCEHVVAVGYVLAVQTDEDPQVILRWRGCALEDARPVQIRSGDPWQGGGAVSSSPRRAPLANSVPRRLGASGVGVDGGDLVEALGEAYAVFGTSSTPAN